MTKFRPCIDLHDGQVKQIVGGSLRDNETTSIGVPKSALKNPLVENVLVENFVAEHSAEWFARKYADDEVSRWARDKIGARQ